MEMVIRYSNREKIVAYIFRLSKLLRPGSKSRA